MGSYWSYKSILPKGNNKFMGYDAIKRSKKEELVLVPIFSFKIKVSDEIDFRDYRKTKLFLIHFICLVNRNH